MELGLGGGAGPAGWSLPAGVSVELLGAEAELLEMRLPCIIDMVICILTIYYIIIMQWAREALPY